MQIENLNREALMLAIAYNTMQLERLHVLMACSFSIQIIGIHPEGQTLPLSLDVGTPYGDIVLQSLFTIATKINLDNEKMIKAVRAIDGSCI